MPVDVEKLEELLAKATPGPWFYSPYRGQIGSQVWAGENLSERTLILEEGDASDADAALIVEAVNALPALLAEVRELREASAVVREKLARFKDAYADAVDEGGNYLWDKAEGAAEELSAALSPATPEVK